MFPEGGATTACSGNTDNHVTLKWTKNPTNKSINMRVHNGFLVIVQIDFIVTVDREDTGEGLMNLIL